MKGADCFTGLGGRMGSKIKGQILLNDCTIKYIRQIDRYLNLYLGGFGEVETKQDILL